MEPGEMNLMGKNDFFHKTTVKSDKKAFSFSWSIDHFSLLTDKISLPARKTKKIWQHNPFTLRKRVCKKSKNALTSKEGIKSPVFTTEDPTGQKYFWYFVIWPWIIRSDDEYFGFWLMLAENLHCKLDLHEFSQVNTVLSLLSLQGEKCFPEHYEFGESSGWSFDKWNKFKCISRKKLQEYQEILLPNDTITLHCELEIKFKLSLETFACGEAKRAISSKVFSDLKSLFELQKNCDVTFVCGGVEFKAHRNILSDRCEVFDRMFDNKMTEDNTGVVKIQDIGASVFEKLLRFIYGMEIEVPLSICIELYYASDKYNLMELMKQCSAILVRNLNAENVFEVAVAADAHSDNELFLATKSFVKNYSSEVLSKKFVDDVIQCPGVAKRLVE